MATASGKVMNLQHCQNARNVKKPKNLNVKLFASTLSRPGYHLCAELLSGNCFGGPQNPMEFVHSAIVNIKQQIASAGVNFGP